ncbi:alpha/beta hydrolase [Streptomyces sp. 4N509B]|uniref:alpha/beta hydrolase n=1 Tax=Streptomyces sp. 4N509B TaxID=3457413 RepID=UPI003FD5A2D9
MRFIVRIIPFVLRALALLSPRLAGRAAFFLFCRPLVRAKVRDRDRVVHDRAERSSVTVDGNTVAVYRWGGGDRPVLMAHGWGGRASNFSTLVQAFSDRGVPVVAFDAPGHGESSGTTTHILHYEEIVQRLAKDHGPFRGTVAHSFGNLGVFKALRSGVEADRVVSVSGVCDFSYLLDTFAERLRLGEPVRQQLRVRSERLLASGTDIWERFSACHDPDLVRGSVLVVQDEDDDTVSLAQARRLAAAFEPRSRLMTTSSLGHRRIVHTEAVVTAVVDFVTDDD